MNVNLLIDAIVRQTTVLIAQLATAAGARAPLAHTANRVFFDLVREFREQGLGNKVIADMFGLSLRTYHNKIARLSESTTDRGLSLWEALLAYVSERPSVTRAQVLSRFEGDDEPTLRGVLKDLVDSGLLFRSGRGDLTTYRAARVEEGPRDAASSVERTASLVWVAVHRYGPLTLAPLRARSRWRGGPLRAARGSASPTTSVDVQRARTGRGCSGSWKRLLSPNAAAPTGPTRRWSPSPSLRRRKLVLPRPLSTALASATVRTRHARTVRARTGSSARRSSRTWAWDPDCQQDPIA